MNEQQLQDQLDFIKKGMRLFDAHVSIPNYETGEGKLTEKQVDIVNALFDVFKSLGWQLKFNNYKELKYDDSKPINLNGCGTPVKVRPCDEKYGAKTYFGILLGDVALGITHSIQGNVVSAGHTMYNPAIFIPELKTIVYGCGSWWGEIESEEDLSKVITDETISNVWYMKVLRDLNK